MNRKQRRALEKEMGKSRAKDMSQTLSQFEQLPDECLACTKSFDKKDRKMVNTWHVVVREPDTVRLYCPDCWKMAMKVITDMENSSR